MGNSARGKLFNVRAGQQTGVSSCMSNAFHEYGATWDFKGMTFTAKGHIEELDAAACLREAKSILNLAQNEPANQTLDRSWRGPGFDGQDLVLTSGFFYILRDAGMVKNEMGEPVESEACEAAGPKYFKLADIEAKRDQVCVNNNFDFLDKPMLCADITYVYAALKFGWKIGDEQTFRVIKKISDVEVTWTFGVALSA